MRGISDLSDKELRQEYVFVSKRYNELYKQKKDIEEEMVKRYELELEENRK